MHQSDMRLWLLFVLMVSPLLGQGAKLPKRQIVPLEVKARAQAAVDRMIKETVAGDYKAVIDSMNPDYLKVLARGKGGTKKMKAHLLKELQSLGKKGVTYEAAITQRATQAFEVDFGVEERMVRGKKEKVGGYRRWMVFVPTVANLRILDQSVEPSKLRKYRKQGFVIAIAPKAKERWTFIDGANINSLELRKLFPFLPKDEKKIGFPEKSFKEIKKKRRR